MVKQSLRFSLMSAHQISKHFNHRTHISLMLISVVSSTCQAATTESNNNPLWVLLILVVIFLQSILIAALQRSRLKNKEAKNALKLQQKDLEQTIQERTQNLYQKNIELEAAIENHKVIAVQLLDTKRHLQTMINSVPDILVGVSADGNITYWNTAAFEKTRISFDKALGAHIFDALPQLPITTEQLSHIIKNEKPFINRRILHTELNEHKFYDLRIYPLLSTENSGAVIQLNNVTKQVQIENMMIQTEKMSSLGELAAGIAHEINNPLGIILHNTQNIIRRTSTELPSNILAAEKLGLSLQGISSYLQDRQIHLFLDNIKDAGERAASIVNNMLEFSRTTHNKKTWIDVKKLVEQSIELNINAGFADPEKMAAIKVKTHYSNNLPLIYASAPELQQVLLNLLRNAYQALISEKYHQQEELIVTITTDLNSHRQEIIIQVSDNGPGIKESIIEHIFEPFFTTKEVGEGTGLGLSVSYFIITEHHQGSINISSIYGKGAAFTICLPILTEPPSSLDL